MINLTCTSCRTVLQIDDAFAGGVCRCQHCGAIQTVPSSLKDKKAGSVAGLSAKTLYKSVAVKGEAVPSSGLDELAQIVVSSGLASSRLRSRAAAPPAPKPSSGRFIILGGAGAALALVIALVVWLLTRTAPWPAPERPAGGSAANGPAAAIDTSTQAAGANFCGVPLNQRVIVYLLDRGSGTTELFSYLKEAAYRSAESLGPERKFQIIFWNNGDGDDAYPMSGPTYATPQNVESARRALDSVYAHGQSDVASALRKALASNPDAIILATGKGFQLDDAFVQQVMEIRGSRPIPIHTFPLGGTESVPPLEAIAQKTGGQSQLISEVALKRAGR